MEVEMEKVEERGMEERENEVFSPLPQTKKQKKTHKGVYRTIFPNPFSPPIQLGG
jgi:hypothetical protein